MNKLILLLIILIFASCSNKETFEVNKTNQTAEINITAVKCEDTVINENGSFCYHGTPEENNNFTVNIYAKFAQRYCVLKTMYPPSFYPDNITVKIKLNSNIALDTYIVDDPYEAFEDCTAKRSIRYVKLYNLEDSFEDELIIKPDYQFLFSTKTRGGDNMVNITLDYSSNVHEQCSCEE